MLLLLLLQLIESSPADTQSTAICPADHCESNKHTLPLHHSAVINHILRVRPPPRRRRRRLPLSKPAAAGPKQFFFQDSAVSAVLFPLLIVLFLMLSGGIMGLILSHHQNTAGAPTLPHPSPIHPTHAIIKKKTYQSGSGAVSGRVHCRGNEDLCCGQRRGGLQTYGSLSILKRLPGCHGAEPCHTHTYTDSGASPTFEGGKRFIFKKNNNNKERKKARFVARRLQKWQQELKKNVEF